MAHVVFQSQTKNSKDWWVNGRQQYEYADKSAFKNKKKGSDASLF